MNFLGLGPGELLVVMVLALIVFGPQKLPEIGKGLGKAIGEFRRATSEITQEFNRELQLDSILNPTAEQAAPAQKNRAPGSAAESSNAPATAIAEEQPGSEPAAGDIAPEPASTTGGAAEAAAFQHEETVASPAEESVAVEADGAGDSNQEKSSGEL